MIQDRAFWEEQERTRRERVSQPCCTLSGITDALARMPGNFCVVVHGERDCLNSFRSFSCPGSSRVFCSGLRESDCVQGRAAAALRRCVEAVVRDRRPELVLVLGTCLTEMLGEDEDGSLAGLSGRLGAPILPLRTSGLKLSSEQGMLDLLWSALADWALSDRDRRPQHEVPGTSCWGRRERADAVYVFGLPSEGFEAELRRVLERCAVRLGACIPGAGLEAWRRVAWAQAAFVVDRPAYPLLTRRLEAAGVDVIDAPLPVGLASTRRFFEVVAGRLGRAASSRAIGREAAACERSIAGFRRAFGARRLAYALRMGANYQVDRLACGGLGDLGVFTELGFKPTVLVQGSPGGKSRAFFAESLGRLGWRGGLTMFSDPYLLAPLLRRGRFDLAYLNDQGEPEAKRAGVPWIGRRHLEPFFRGARSNVERVRGLLERRP